MMAADIPIGGKPQTTTAACSMPHLPLACPLPIPASGGYIRRGSAGGPEASTRPVLMVQVGRPSRRNYSNTVVVASLQLQNSLENKDMYRYVPRDLRSILFGQSQRCGA
ncbi:hypothetical protein B0H67DRAFT_269909 [Lasiosphaeris hirsuta]|uniref:Uncharacterized protein n=1 Tax=Lasiosphaeris hirsuta TaxID=260670 RepID=A0AA40A855_9PEZI|nr:hypothetical protein B0H67DRAFT_269909 [Lasiosphaeris hirsuta]